MGTQIYILHILICTYIDNNKCNYCCRYMKRDRKSVLIERDDIVRWRRKYLTTIKEYRRQNRPIYYLDETWLNEGHTKEKVWVG